MKSKLFGAVTAIAVATAAPTAHAATFTYSLNGSYAEDSNSGPSLVKGADRSRRPFEL